MSEKAMGKWILKLAMVLLLLLLLLLL